jgi:hypothetical protein
MPGQGRQFFDRLLAAMMKADRQALEELVHPDYVGDFPQSGERGRGLEPFWAQLKAYPGGAPGVEEEIPGIRIIGDDQRWAISPGYTVVALANPMRFTLTGSVRYPDGVTWHIIMSVELRDGRLFRSESFFAPQMAAPLAQSIATYGKG